MLAGKNTKFQHFRTQKSRKKRLKLEISNLQPYSFSGIIVCSKGLWWRCVSLPVEMFHSTKFSVVVWNGNTLMKVQKIRRLHCVILRIKYEHGNSCPTKKLPLGKWTTYRRELKSWALIEANFRIKLFLPSHRSGSYAESENRKKSISRKSDCLETWQCDYYISDNVVPSNSFWQALHDVCLGIFLVARIISSQNLTPNWQDLAL